MNDLRHLLKLDLMLLHRNNMFVLALVVSVIYVGVFYLLAPIVNLDLLVVILIFNDPVITGFLFAGVLWLFDKNQNTLQAVAVLPIRTELYLWSKALILTSLAVAISFIMAIAIRGLHFDGVRLLLGVGGATLLFAGLGFLLGARSLTFNQFLMYAIPFLVVMGVPFLALFDIGDMLWYQVFPSAGGLGLIKSAFVPGPLWKDGIYLLQLLAWNWLVWRYARRLTLTHFV